MLQDAACTILKGLAYLEIQRGQAPMRKKKFVLEVGSTAACTLRLIEGSEYCGQMNKERQDAKNTSRKQLIVADSWFGSVRLAENIKMLHRKYNDDGTSYKYVIDRSRKNPDAHEIIASVKSNSGWFPKKEIVTKMKDWPSGAYLVLKCKSPKYGVDLVALGYKYNSSKVLTFVMTKDAGCTNPGDKKYHARFPDKYGNVHERLMQRPEILSQYFDVSDIIDSHNHLRQFRLGLESHWITRNPWFRISTSLFGMTITDVHRASQYHANTTDNKSDGPLKGMTICDCANFIAHDLIHNKYPRKVSTAEAPRAYLPPANTIAATRNAQLFVENTRSQVTTAFNYALDHMSSTICSMPSHVNLGSPRDSIGSGLTESTAPVFNPFVHIDIGTHDPAPNSTKSKSDDGRPTKRSCVICNRGTRYAPAVNTTNYTLT